MTSNGHRRVAITGIGVVSCGGVGVPAFWDTLVNGRSCLGRITRFDTSELKVHIGGEIHDFDVTRYVDRPDAARLDRVSAYALTAASEAIRDSGFDMSAIEPGRIGVSLGTSMGGTEAGIHRAFGGINRLEGRSPSWMLSARDDARAAIAEVFAGDLTMTVLDELGIDGEGVLISTGCTAASDALGYAYESIRHGRATIVIAGGSEAPIGPLTLQAFDAIGALSHRNDAPEIASRPFDRDRDGFVLAEGAGILVLEALEHARRRRARIYAELAGYETSCDAYHLTASDPAMRESSRVIESALRTAGISHDEVDYISAHASSTPMNDKRESDIIKTVFGERAYRIPVSGIKSMVGHCSGAAGSLQAVSCALAMSRGVLPPTANYETPDPECDLDYVPNVAREADVRAILQNTYAFAGKNVALVYRRVEDQRAA